MPVEEITQQHYRAQQVVARKTVDQAQGLWSQVEPTSVLETWLALLAEMLRVLIAGQTAAAAQAQPYMAALAAAQGIPPAALAVAPLAFAGVAADGRALASLLMQPALRTLGLLAAGADDHDALRSGLASLTRIVDTEISDASRAADHVGMVANRSWVMYVRHVNLPACGRCIILAGRTYSWSQGFQRHPRCDCGMTPVRSDDAYASIASPEELFARMTRKEQDKAFTLAGAEAIRLGSDMGQVVNARRGMTTTAQGRKITTEGTTVRGWAGKKLGNLKKMPGERYRRSQTIRPMPEELLKEADGDRDLAIQLLERFGYLDKYSQASAATARRAVASALN